MKTKVTILALLLAGSLLSQVRDDKYLAVATNYAVNHNDNLVMNAIGEAGVTYHFLDVSARYEFVNLRQKYHSFSAGVGVVIIDKEGWLFIPGGKYGVIMRDTADFNSGTQYYGIDVEVRKNINRFFVAIEVSSDYRTDLGVLWDDADWKESVHLKVGFKL